MASRRTTSARTDNIKRLTSGRLQSFRYAARGIAFMLRSQHNAWIHLAITIVVCITAWWMRVSVADWCWLTVAVVLVWVAETTNTAFE